MLGFKVNLFELIEGIREGVFGFLGNFFWTLIVLLRHPVRGPKFLATRFQNRNYLQIGPFTLITTFVLCALLIFASNDHLRSDEVLRTPSGQPVTINASDYLDLLSTSNAVLLLLTSALFAILLQGMQWVFFRRLRSFSTKQGLEKIHSALGYSSVPVLLTSTAFFMAGAIPVFLILLMSESIRFLGAGEDNEIAIFLSFSTLFVLAVSAGCIFPVISVRRHMRRALKAGSILAEPLNWRNALFRCTVPYFFAVSITSGIVVISLPEPPRIWISHVKCSAASGHIRADFIVANQTAGDIIVPRDFFEIEVTPDHGGVGGFAAAGFFSVLTGTAHNVRGQTMFSTENSRDIHTAVILEGGKIYHGTLVFELGADQLADLNRFLSGTRELRCRLHPGGRQNSEIVRNVKFEYPMAAGEQISDE
ncbi:hypothetical protein [Pararhodobacter sp. SW119]|uniref:hypothetical protein n=1 Tax=Pararhodobacter sp. SW119 TaxID=2780075 RepID=UPI001ADEC87B|nr:hypothetical protein [Pararhodobacter sp. SW119]